MSRALTLEWFAGCSPLMDTTMVPEEAVLSPLTCLLYSFECSIETIPFSFTVVNGLDDFKNGFVEIDPLSCTGLGLLLVIETTVVNGLVIVTDELVGEDGDESGCSEEMLPDLLLSSFPNPSFCKDKNMKAKNGSINKMRTFDLKIDFLHLLSNFGGKWGSFATEIICFCCLRRLQRFSNSHFLWYKKIKNKTTNVLSIENRYIKRHYFQTELGITGRQYKWKVTSNALSEYLTIFEFSRPFSSVPKTLPQISEKREIAGRHIFQSWPEYFSQEL